jgi:membrane fusion protein, multidrug efflux system
MFNISFESSMYMKKNLFYLVLALVLSYSCGSHSEKNKAIKTASKSLAVEGFVAQPALLDLSISVSGTLKSFEETVLMPEVSGRVVEIHLQEGKPVKKGSLLVKIFDGDLQAQLKKLQAQLQITEQTRKRQSDLLKISGISQIDYDQTVLQVNSINADIDVMKAQIRKTEILAPYDGIIGLRNISLGAQISPSTAVTTIRAVQQLKIDFSIPEKYSKEVSKGKKLKFTVQGDDTKYDASVMATEEGIDAVSRNLKVRALVLSKSSSLVPGKFANIELTLGEDKNALMIPTQAIIPQERDKKVILSKNGKAKMVTVKTGIRKESAIEIVSGIEAGDTVLTTGILFIKAGDVIKFSKVLK